MKRRILLLVGSFLMLALAVWVYHLISGGTIISIHSADHPLRMPAPSSTQPMPKGPSIPGGWQVDIQDRPDGRLRGRYRARKWKKRDDGSYLLTRPNIVMYQSDGQHVYITAEHAEVFAEEVGDGWSVSRGSLYGSVKIFLDRDVDREMPQNEPEKFFEILQADPRHVVRIYADDLQFNNELLELHSNSRISVLSDEADIFGRGISIRWNEQPRELRELRILQGQYMAIYSIPSEMGAIALPGPVDTASQAPAAGEDQDQPTPQEVIAATRPAAKATTAPAVATTAPATTAPAVASAATTKPAATTAASVEKSNNIYVAEFIAARHRIHVNSGRRRLSGADKLTLKFEWGAQRGDLTKPKRRRRRRRATTTPAQPTIYSPVDRPAPAVVAETPTTKPAATPDENAADDAVIITWSGPLVIRPIGYTPSPSKKRYTLSADGDLVLSDPKATAECKKLIYQLPQQRGWLIGDEDNDVRLTVENDQQVICRWLRFSRANGTAYLQGPGSMTGGQSDLKLQTGKKAATKPAEKIAKKSGGGDKIEWGGTVDISFGQKKVTDSSGVEKTRQFIKDATFKKKVELTQGSGGDFVRCDKLYVQMATDETGGAYPTKAVAAGNVSAKQETSIITAREATVCFKRMADKNDAEKMVVRPVHVTAAGDVQIIDNRDAQILTASADHLTSDIVSRKAELFGNDQHFATVSQGENYLAGDEIYLDDSNSDSDSTSAVVKGRGSLKFHSDRDLSGGQTDKSRPIDIDWDDGMEYHSAKNLATFTGNVVLNSDKDQMKCKKMRVMFTKTTEKPADADEGKDKDKKSRRRLGVSVDQYSKRKLSMIVADFDVVVRSTRKSADGRLLQRLKMTGGKLIYDVEKSHMRVLGEGTLVAEDYNKPRTKKDKKAAGEPSTGMTRPWQTMFEWSESMAFSQTERKVNLDGSVSMVHRSGKQIILTDKLNIPKWKNIGEGRKSALNCRKLIAIFAEADEKKKSRKGDKSSQDMMAGGPRLGPLEKFTAFRDVNLKDGDVRIFGQKLIYDRRKEIAIVLGSLPGDPPTNAKVFQEDQATGKSRNWSSPTITCHFRGNQIKEVITQGITGGGGN